jgi:hypothetical protein
MYHFGRNADNWGEGFKCIWGRGSVELSTFCTILLEPKTVKNSLLKRKQNNKTTKSYNSKFYINFIKEYVLYKIS